MNWFGRKPRSTASSSTFAPEQSPGAADAAHKTIAQLRETTLNLDKRYVLLRWEHIYAPHDSKLWFVEEAGTRLYSNLKFVSYNLWWWFSEEHLQRKMDACIREAKMKIAKGDKKGKCQMKP